MLGKRSAQHSLFEPLMLPHRVPEDSLYGRMGQVIDILFRDEELGEMYCLDNGRPSLPPSLMSGVMLLQFHDNVSDDEAVQRLQFDLRWKVALRLPLDFAGFDSSSLCVFRARLRKHGKERHAFDRMVEVGREAGFLPPRLQVLIDSTHMLGAGATEDTYTLVRHAIRKLLRAMGYHLPQRRKKLGKKLECYLEGRYKPKIDWSDPQARKEHLQELVADAHSILELALEEAEDEEVRSLGWMLSKILGDDISFDEKGEAEIAQGVAEDRIISVTDPKLRHGRKSSAQRFDGPKLHVVEEPSSEMLLNLGVGAGNEYDGKEFHPMIGGVEEHYGMEVAASIGDGAYGSGDNRAECAKNGIDLVSPLAETHGRLGKSHFHIDLEKQQVTCPEGHTTSRWTWAKDPKKRKVRRFQFPGEVCLHCPRHQECVGERKGGRNITLHYHEVHLIAARERQKTESFQETYRIRSKIERKIAEMITHGLRQARYIGPEKTELQALWTGAGVNLKRLFKLAKGDVRLLRGALDSLVARTSQPIPLRELCTVP
ncbi:MAG: IS1182 family transposase [Chloroflexota bacterium]